MSHSAEMTPQQSAREFAVKHLRMTDGTTYQEFTNRVTADMVIAVRAVTAAELRGLPVTDVSGTHIVPWVAKTCIETIKGNLYVMDVLDYLLYLDPAKTPLERLPEASQLIIAVHQASNDRVKLPEEALCTPDLGVPESTPVGVRYAAYRPKRPRESLLRRITPAHRAIVLGVLGAGGLIGGLVAHKNNEMEFWRSTTCTDVSSPPSLDSFVVTRNSEGLKLTVDQKGNVLVSTDFATGKKITQKIGKVTGDYNSGYNVDISDAYRPTASAAVGVCLKRLKLSIK